MQNQEFAANENAQYSMANVDDIDFEILETTEATAMEEMGASSTIAAGSTCSQPTKLL